MVSRACSLTCRVPFERLAFDLLDVFMKSAESNNQRTPVSCWAAAAASRRRSEKTFQRRLNPSPICTLALAAMEKKRRHRSAALSGLEQFTRLTQIGPFAMDRVTQILAPHIGDMAVTVPMYGPMRASMALAANARISSFIQRLSPLPWLRMRSGIVRIVRLLFLIRSAARGLRLSRPNEPVGAASGSSLIA